METSVQQPKVSKHQKEMISFGNNYCLIRNNQRLFLTKFQSNFILYILFTTMLKKKENSQIVCDYDEKQETLQIRIKKGDEVFKSYLKADSLPKDIEKNLDNLENVYQSLQESENFEFEEDKQELRIKTVTQLKNKKIQKFSVIKLQKQVNEIAYLTEQVNMIKKKVQELDQREGVKINEKIDETFGIVKQTVERQQKLEIKVQQLQKAFEQSQEKLLKEKKERQMLGNKIEILEQKLLNMLDDIEMKRKEERQLAVNKIPFSPNLNTNFAKKYFTINNKRATYIGNEEYNTQLMMTKLIEKKQNSYFELKIIRTRESYIGIGVVDGDRQFNERHSSQSGNAICFWGHNGRIRYGGGQNYKETDLRFKTGDTVLVKVNLEKGLMEWTINKDKKAQINSGMLSSPGRRFFPYFEMPDNNDTVEWIQ